ncbi:nucleoside transporter-domain-containing protein [Zychaea mexicana]|uniref:nucleoside transporter-domain-containing protein n=1 Tax=Zychaea mexicana TaxID=64656 RepID=UPI0022FE8032|nr:nucleoside transporter-domain-containing protein [Zychaea mexicana]KAI9497669.1 nucleoside transporter-domain-containing protein [Zychaea mexicana]
MHEQKSGACSQFFFLVMFEKYKSQFRRLLTRKPEEHYESQSLLSSHSIERLEAYAEGHNDAHNLVYWIFVIYGVAMLLPWNVFITASEFFAKRFAGSSYDETFQNYFSISFTATNLLCFAYLLRKQSESSTYRVDVLWPALANTAVFGITAVTVAVSMQGATYFAFTMALLVFTGATTSYFQVAVFAEACRFPPRYVQAVMSGQGVAGVAVAVASILSAFAGSATEAPDEAAVTRSAFLYFMAAFVITVAALVGRMFVVRQPFYIRQMNTDQAILSNSALDDEEDVEEQNDDEQRYFSSSPRSELSIVAVVRKSSGLVFAVSYVFVITLMLFPSITALIKSVSRHTPQAQGNRFFDDDVFVAFHFVLFNVGDWVGRTLPIYDSMRTFKPKLLAWFSVLRTIFVPAFLFCNVVASDRSLPVVIDNDVVYFLLIWMFAVSNGWLGSLTMMAAPQQESITSAAEKSLVGSVMSFSLVAGLAIGGGMSFFVRWMI